MESALPSPPQRDPLHQQPVGRYIPTAYADFDFASPMFCLGHDIFIVNPAMDWRNDQRTLLDAIDETYEACHDHTRALAGKILLGCSCVATRSVEWHRSQLRQGLMQLLTQVTGPVSRPTRKSKFQYAVGALRYVMVVAFLAAGVTSIGAGGQLARPDHDGDADDAAPMAIHHHRRSDSEAQLVEAAAVV